MDSFKNASMLIIGAVLVAGVAYGFGIWIQESGVPIEYKIPITISMSDEERYDDWHVIRYRDPGDKLPEANFSASHPIDQYYTYLKMETRDTNVVLKVTVTEPDGFSDQMGFIVLDGIVDPGDEGIIDVEWGSVTFSREVVPGEELLLTVIYVLDEGAPAPGNYEVIWTFEDIT